MPLKIQPVRINCDDCVVWVGRKWDTTKDPPAIVVQGEPHAVHEGEWVSMVPIQTMRESLAISQIAASTVGAGSDGRMANVHPALLVLCEELARRIMDWNWTDMAGESLPNPHNRPDVVQSLTADETFWLLNAASAEGDAARKNG